jgi:peptidoglycan/LPS O-acetylase OafA/YrhL
MINSIASRGLDGALSCGIFALACLLALALGKLQDVDPVNQSIHRLGYIEGLRACAALLVLCSHSVAILRFYIDGTYGSLGVLKNMGALGVQIFFSITAYLFIGKILRSGPVNPLSFMRSRVQRIVPMYTFAVLLAIILYALNTGAFATAKEYLNLYLQGFVARPSFMLGGISAVQVIGTIWTLPFEWQFYVAVPFIAYALSSRAMTLMLIVGFFALAVFSVRRAPDVFWIFFIPGALAAFLRMKVPQVNKTSRMVLSGIAVVVVLLAIFTGGVQSYDVKRVIMLTIFISCIALAEPKVLCAKPLAYLGKISYSIYLLQLPCIFMSRWILESSAFFNSPGLPYATVLFFVALIFVLSAMTYRFLEAPCMRWSQKEKETTSTPPSNSVS